MLSKDLLIFEEPKLIFGYNQSTEDPRDGLVLFGPYQRDDSSRVKAGVIGTEMGLVLYKSFVKRLNQPIFSTKTVYGNLKSDEEARPSFPGFESVFGIKWPSEPELFLPVNKVEIDTKLLEKSKKIRASNIVDLFLSKIVRANNEEDNSVNLWVIIIPNSVWKNCRPESAGREISKGTQNFLDLTKGGQTLLFKEDEAYIDEIEKLLDSTSDFHNLLKARLIQEGITAPVQIIVESTLLFKDKLRNKEYDENVKCHLAWTQSTTIYYKLGKLPWKLNDIRDDVCYLGLIFKKGNKEDNNVCSAAQMFLKDGDGTVFRGNIGLWETKKGEYHLDRVEASNVLSMALDDYFYKWNKYPKELFIHGRSHFTDEEWFGFEDAINIKGANTLLTGIVIKAESGKLKIYRDVENEVCNYGVMRGLAFKVSDVEAFLFTKGFVPRLNTSTSMEIPNPIHIIISRGEADLKVVLQDIMALTKLNYNSCIYGDGLPVTLRFSDKIGSILTATEILKSDKKQFKYYI
ncbi:hypothetical protein P1X15_19705 [Runella sp. MFBS21]|uniref:hypothetical protein n=1 Tax=Runella sp. MFBS21 TaxID=3034018 RepID=UPI0023F7BC11|nr:hypothetical protein [Runella sp. MFBS21]MDF7819857.1 hypothetical protein [Runella sp. MFBS21]